MDISKIIFSQNMLKVFFQIYKKHLKKKKTIEKRCKKKNIGNLKPDTFLRNYWIIYSNNINTTIIIFILSRFIQIIK